MCTKHYDIWTGNLVVTKVSAVSANADNVSMTTRNWKD